MLNRRLLLTSSAALVIGGVAPPILGATSANAYPLGSIPATPTRSYGPNGTHWPAHTPRSGHALTLRIDPTWTAIRNAIASVTTAQADRGVIILVRPGTIAGDPGRDLLTGVGSTNSSRNILVTPERGYGTVTLTSLLRMRAVRGVTFARFIAHNVRMTDCTRTAWAQCKLTYGMRFYAATGVVTHCDGYELVMPNSRVNPEDAFSYSAAAGSTLTSCTLEGCYSAPVFLPSGSSAHLDTFQMFGGGYYRGLTLRDTVLFGSNNAALQIGGCWPSDPRRGTNFLTLDHTIVMNQVMSVQTRFPRPSGGTSTGTQAINGGGEPGQLVAVNGTYVLGTMHVTNWKLVQNSYTSNQRSVTGNPAQTGAWTYRADLPGMTASQLTALTPVPTDDYLRRIWT